MSRRSSGAPERRRKDDAGPPRLVRRPLPRHSRRRRRARAQSSRAEPRDLASNPFAVSPFPHSRRSLRSPRLCGEGRVPFRRSIENRKSAIENVFTTPVFLGYTSVRPIRLRCYPLSLDGRGKGEGDLCLVRRPACRSAAQTRRSPEFAEGAKVGRRRVPVRRWTPLGGHIHCSNHMTRRAQLIAGRANLRRSGAAVFLR